MTILQTSMRQTRESARRIRFEPVSPLTATDVQSAIQQAAALALPAPPTVVSFAMSPYTPLAADQLLLVDTSGGAVTINLTASASRGGAPIEVKDATGNADANPISVNRNGAETIDLLTTVTIDSKFMAIKFAPKTGGYAIV